MSQRLPISVIIITKDEESQIERCVSSVHEFDEVFVVDSGSTDRTCELAAASGARIVSFAWDGCYPKKKQWSLEHAPARNDWVLYLDGDEFVTPVFVAELRRLVAAPTASAYDVGLDYVFLGRRLAHGHRVYKRIFFDRTKCAWRELDDLGVDKPFEVELSVQPDVSDGRVARMESRITHDDREPLSHWFDRHNRYSDWEAMLRASGNDARTTGRTRQGRIFQYAPFKPLLFFVYSFLVRSGFRDGYAGLHYALANSFYWWQVGVKTRELRDPVV